MRDIKISPYRRSGARIFTARDNGIRAREELGLDQCDKMEEEVCVLIPKDTWSLNPSFFGGLFELSIKKYMYNFLDKYNFLYTDKSELSDTLQNNIQTNFDYVIRSIGEEEKDEH